MMVRYLATYSPDSGDDLSKVVASLRQLTWDAIPLLADGLKSDTTYIIEIKITNEGLEGN